LIEKTKNSIVSLHIYLLLRNKAQDTSDISAQYSLALTQVYILIRSRVAAKKVEISSKAWNPIIDIELASNIVIIEGAVIGAGLDRYG
jgi:hypothetical protein